MKNLKLSIPSDSITSEVFFALQLRIANELFLPKLKTFQCEDLTDEFIPFIPLFLSSQTSEITIEFGDESHPIADASIITRLPTLCPKLERITLNLNYRDPVITEAVSEMLLACNRDSLKVFSVDCPLTEEAQEVVCQLPKLSKLSMVIQGQTRLPPVSLPNLTYIDLEYDDHLDWLQGFRGMALKKLESVHFHSESGKIGDFLGEFESVALTTSIKNTLSTFEFYASCTSDPNYSSLLSFKQLKILEIGFSCYDGCSSTVDDQVIITLAQAMPKLETLRLGGAPCGTSTGATIDGLIGPASRCPRLSALRVHFQAYNLIDAATNATTVPSLNGEREVQREGCALTDLEVGDTPISPQSASTLVLILLHIFPHIRNVKYNNREWETVAETVKRFRQIGTFVHHRGEGRRYVQLSLQMTRYQESGIDIKPRQEKVRRRRQ